ncbi:MAG TPA: G5 domain-containing protein, partial [Candidatus Eremiobacteraceae bacterium]|nr:G5 domain-containing protein [Candidatus Eremiobacteraceae bacterium]
MTTPKPTRTHTLLRIAGLLAVAIFVASIQYTPSAALPLIESGFSLHRDALHRGSVPPPRRDQLSFANALPRSSVILNNVHSLLTTPKVDSIPQMAESATFESLSIRTEVRAHRTYAAAQPVVRFTTDMLPGTKKIVRRGRPGISVVTERVTLWNDVVVDRQIISRVAVQRTQPGLIVAGPPRSLAEAMAVTGIRKLVAVYAMIATAYTAGSAQAMPTGLTATGLAAHYGVVAVDPRVIRLGSR